MTEAEKERAAVVAWLRSLWQQVIDWFAPEQPPAFTPPRLTVELRPFNWLDDYGTHWEPGSTAFWLEPRKESDLIAWLRRYRPEFEGEFEAAGLTVTVKPRDLSPLLGLGNYDPQSALWAQMQSIQAQTQANLAYANYQNSLMRRQDFAQNAFGLGGLFRPLF